MPSELTMSLRYARIAVCTGYFIEAKGWLRNALAEANRIKSPGARARMRSRIITALNHLRVA